MVRETESGITYFEYDMRLPNGIFKNQIEICYEGYFVNYTSMPDVVYESDDLTKKWNGKSQSGIDVIEGVYFYKIEYALNATNKPKSGFVSVVR